MKHVIVELSWQLLVTAAPLLLLGCGADNSPSDVSLPTTPSPPVFVESPLPTGEPSVRVIYAIPADREFRQDYSDGVTRAITAIQGWYREQLGGPTFAVYDTIPHPCHMTEPGGWYATDTESTRQAWHRVLEAVQHCAAIGNGYDGSISSLTYSKYVRPGDITVFDKWDHLWVVYADVDEPCPTLERSYRLGKAWLDLGTAILGRWDLHGLSDSDALHCNRGPWGYGRWIGGLGHELGHILAAVPHPPGCDQNLPTCDRDALMKSGYAAWPNTYLRDDEKLMLLTSPFIRE